MNGVFCLTRHLYVQLPRTVSNGDRRVSDGNKRERITIRLTKRYLDLLNTLIEKGVYNSRNEAIRDALRIMYEYHGLKVSPEKKRCKRMLRNLKAFSIYAGIEIRMLLQLCSLRQCSIRCVLDRCLCAITV